MFEEFEKTMVLENEDLYIDGFSSKTGATECGSSCVDSCCC